MYIISQILTKIDIYVNLVLEKEKVHSYLLLPTLVYFLYIAKKNDKIASAEWTIYDFLILFFVFCAQLFFYVIVITFVKCNFQGILIM